VLLERTGEGEGWLKGSKEHNERVGDPGNQRERHPLEEHSNSGKKARRKRKDFREEFLALAGR